MDNADIIEKAEIEVFRLIQVCHKQLSYWEILKIFLDTCQKLQMQADAEYWIRR